MKAPRVYLITGMALLAMLACAPIQAQTKEALDAGVLETVKQFILLDPHHEHLLKKAAGILVFPRITKGGIALASEYGEGALQIDGATVEYYSVAAASVGLTAGMATHSEIILFMTAEALDKFRGSTGWSIGADTRIAVISKGFAEDYESSTLKKPILVFVFAGKGLIADLSIGGSKINKIVK